MGIDKPDIRRIIHYGPPKTFEEYYQQIGRAGRDGLASYCQLIYSRSEFNNYKTDFYMGGLPPGARETVERSLHKLREYADDIENCRRCLIVNFFGIQSSIPIVDCNSCDNCIKKVFSANYIYYSLRKAVKEF